MNRRRPTVPGARQTALACLALGLGILAAGTWTPAAGAAASAVSGNWAGYVASPKASAGSRFSSVSGSWRQPAAVCPRGRESFSAVWVGLGGYGEGARALEQVGTDANCTSSGRATYATWFELVPAGPVELKLKVRPGDRVSASVTVRGSRVTVRLRNLTTGARFSTTRRYSRPDVSTAEWIVEAPSDCPSSNRCTTLALANFGTVAFSSATATARGRTGTILDPGWSAFSLELQQSSRGASPAGAGQDTRFANALTLATPSAVARSSGSFSVTWSERATASERRPAPTLPGFGGAGP